MIIKPTPRLYLSENQQNDVNCPRHIVTNLRSHYYIESARLKPHYLHKTAFLPFEKLRYWLYHAFNIPYPYIPYRTKCIIIMKSVWKPYR